MSEIPTRSCLSCKLPKPRSSFPLARGERNISPRCWVCVEEHAKAIDGRISTFHDARGLVRRCSGCHEVYPLTDYWWANKDKGKRFNRCPKCQAERNKANYRAKMSDPIRAARERKRSSAATKRRREAIPEYAEKMREAHRRWEEKKKKDPRWKTKRAEDRRVNYRAKREIKGLPVRPADSPKLKARKMSEKVRSVPVGPLVALIERTIAQRAVIATEIGDPDFATTETVCRDLTLATRTFRGWRNGQYLTARVGVAERIMLAADVEPSEVFSRDDYPEALALFEEVEIDAK